MVIISPEIAKFTQANMKSMKKPTPEGAFRVFQADSTTLLLPLGKYQLIGRNPPLQHAAQPRSALAVLFSLKLLRNVFQYYFYDVQYSTTKYASE